MRTNLNLIKGEVFEKMEDLGFTVDNLVGEPLVDKYNLYIKTYPSSDLTKRGFIKLLKLYCDSRIDVVNRHAGELKKTLGSTTYQKIILLARDPEELGWTQENDNEYTKEVEGNTIHLQLDSAGINIFNSAGLEKISMTIEETLAFQIRRRHLYESIK